jgi:hypothetical protein
VIGLLDSLKKMELTLMLLFKILLKSGSDYVEVVS